MSNLDALQPTEGEYPPFVVAASDHEPLVEYVDEVLDRVRETIAPVWPLKDYVAVNPYGGLSERRFTNARRFLQAFSDCELLMPLEYFAEQYQRGRFGLSDIQAAIDEQAHGRFESPPSLSPAEIEKRLREVPGTNAAPSQEPQSSKSGRRICTFSEFLDRYTGSEWTSLLREEIGKHCAAHYDEGQAMWPSPWKHLPLYQAWRSAARHDRNLELLGLTEFRSFASQLPHTPEAAIVFSLRSLGVPPRLWETLLLCQAFAIPGWCAWAKYQFEAARRAGEANMDFAGVLAIRLAYEAALGRALDFRVSWESVVSAGCASGEFEISRDDAALRHTLLRASEIGYRRELLKSLGQRRGTAGCDPGAASAPSPRKGSGPPRKRAQVVFCIDVRSEPMRRHLESSSGEIETFGFAGFFGVPIEYVPLGETSGTSQVPALLTPQFQVREDLRLEQAAATAKAVHWRSVRRTIRKAWKVFQSSAVSCFACVEATGLLHAYALLGRTHQRPGRAFGFRFDGIPRRHRERLGPTLVGLNRQGLTTSHQADLAESILRGLGLTRNFARLVVFCGHGSQTQNNPLQAGLDCGACGGHSGESNARFAAMLLNQPYIRRALAARGLRIPGDTHFLAGLHNTATDSIEFFDLADLPPTHTGDVQELAECAAEATERTRAERLPILSSQTVAELLRRGRDWSETRPEWGLAGNAAFIAAPRSLTSSLKLDGRVFLHSYEHNDDPQGAVLEQIMTAPMIVAHWINMQYYASTVDSRYFGSGTKTIHNVVGQFGIFSGNGGDLMTGLPWESVHTGRAYQHQPLRLLAVIAAPRAAIEAVIGKHPPVESLLTNGWLHLVAADERSFYSYTQEHSWHLLHSDAEQLC